MQMETVSGIFLAIWLGCFLSVNLYNILIVRKRRLGEKFFAEVERPSSFSVGLAALGTYAYFFEVLLYLFFVFSGLIYTLRGFPFGFPFSFVFYMQVLGLILTSVGYFLFIWSVVARGRYAVSWEMPEKHRLVTWGPYRYVRHPSYLGYFFMFFGFFCLWPNLFSFFPLLAIPGYVRATFQEERLLTRRFGDVYLEYQRKTGRFLPRFR